MVNPYGGIPVEYKPRKDTDIENKNERMPPKVTKNKLKSDVYHNQCIL